MFTGLVEEVAKFNRSREVLFLAKLQFKLMWF